MTSKRFMSNLTITIKDETIGGNILNEIKIQIASERTTVREIIEARVTAEVQDYNQRSPLVYYGLVKPSDSESELNGYRLRKRDMKIDPEQQIYTALDAFQQNGFFVLIDNNQAEYLDQEVLVNQRTEVSFIKLTPLVGG
ncbi:hypothetical protein [Desertivirga brevis]|uniref:hypothetical protein n=1 Tax=Desertivirga brevis TaxID=2810310 RepID=UPI001A9706C0|nr:hypothetical protein [Pedobacter sp. SYSU D00873]